MTVSRLLKMLKTDGIESSYSRGLVYSMTALLFLLTPSLGLYKWVVLHQLCFQYFCLNSLLEARGDMWELDKGAEKDSKLDQYLRSGPNIGRQVLTTLSAISYTFANATRNAMA